MKRTATIIRNTLVGLSLLSLVICCTDDEIEKESNLIGTWKLKEVLFDPGDGSGEFQPVDINKNIEFLLDGTISSDQYLCFAGNAAGSPSSGVYILPDSILQIDDCPDTPIPMRFSVQGQSLIISYPCIEPCQEKYVKVD